MIDMMIQLDLGKDCGLGKKKKKDKQTKTSGRWIKIIIDQTHFTKPLPEFLFCYCSLTVNLKRACNKLVQTTYVVFYGDIPHQKNH